MMIQTKQVFQNQHVVKNELRMMIYWIRNDGDQSAIMVVPSRGTKTQNFPGSNFLRAKNFPDEVRETVSHDKPNSALLPLTTLPKNA